MKVYLAGPINGCTDEQVFGWRRDLKSRMPKIEFVDPTDRDYRGVEDANVTELVQADLADIRGCDAVVAYCPFPSYGTAMEIVYASLLGKRVLVFIPPGLPVSPWLRHHSNVVLNYVQEVEAQLITWGYGCSTSPTHAVTP